MSTQEKTTKAVIENLIADLVLAYAGEAAVNRWARKGQRSKQSLRETVRRSTSNLLTRGSLYKRG